MSRTAVTRTAVARTAVSRSTTMIISRQLASMGAGGLPAKPIVPLWTDGTTIYGSSGGNGVGSGGPGALGRYLYKSVDGLMWTLVHDFGTRNQGPGTYNDIIRAVEVTPAGTMLVTCCADWSTCNGALFRSTDDGANFTNVITFVTGVSVGWNLDSNAAYVVAGTYGKNDTEGLLDRDVWISTDDGANWASCFHVEGDGTTPSKLNHIHMARIDPQGGCWVSVGDSNNSSYEGLYHSVGTPATVADGATDFGSFTKVYSGNNIRPVCCLFLEEDGKSYIYLGEDKDTSGANRTFTKIRYDDASYTAVVKADFTDTIYNGGIFGIVQITADYWVACTAVDAGSTPALYETRDAGETWARDASFPWAIRYMCRVPFGGLAYGGRPDDHMGCAYSKPTLSRTAV